MKGSDPLPGKTRLRRAIPVALLLVGLALRGGAADSLAVTDGDGFRLNGERIRLWGIDAPELRQICERAALPYPCGEEARAARRGLWAGTFELPALWRERN